MSDDVLNEEKNNSHVSTTHTHSNGHFRETNVLINKFFVKKKEEEKNLVFLLY